MINGAEDFDSDNRCFILGRPPQPILSGESHYDVTVTDGNATVGDSSSMIVGTGTPR